MKVISILITIVGVGWCGLSLGAFIVAINRNGRVCSGDYACELHSAYECPRWWAIEPVMGHIPPSTETIEMVGYDKPRLTYLLWQGIFLFVYIFTVIFMLCGKSDNTSIGDLMNAKPRKVQVN